MKPAKKATEIVSKVEEGNSASPYLTNGSALYIKVLADAGFSHGAKI
jgi:hypothetical protein